MEAAMFKFIKTTVVGGVLFILPLVLVAVLIEKAIHLLRGPVQKLLPMFADYDVAGVALLSLVTLAGLMLLCFLAGLLARTAAARRTLESVENNVLGKLPGYQLVKETAERFAGLENIDGAKVGLLREDENWRLCMVCETSGDWATIFIPDGGMAGVTAGEVRIAPMANVVITDINWLPVINNLKRGGRGLLELAQPWMQHPDAAAAMTPGGQLND
jgi:hypothetical protein